MIDNPPPGFRLLDCAHLPFNQLTGPLYINEGEMPLRPRFGMFVLEQHCDDRGMVERGVLATLADFVAGRSLVIDSNFELACFTISLNLEFTGSVAKGGWIETQANIIGRNGNVAYSGCEIVHQGRAVLLANGKFKTFARVSPQS